MKITRGKKFDVFATPLKFPLSLKFWQFLRYQMAILAKWPKILAIFEISNGHFGEMAENIGIFFRDF